MSLNRLATEIHSNAVAKGFYEEKKEGVKDTLEDEMADSIIRALDMCGYLNIDIQAHVEAKMRYNSTRGYKHGKE